MNRRLTNGGACTRGFVCWFIESRALEIGTRCRRPSQWRRWRHWFGRETGANGAEKKETEAIVYPPSLLILSPFPFFSPMFSFLPRSTFVPVDLLKKKKRGGGEEKRKRGKGKCEKLQVYRLSYAWQDIVEWTMVFRRDDTRTDLGQRRVVNGVACPMTSRGANPCNWVNSGWFCHGRSYKRTRVVLPRFPRLFAWKRVPATGTLHAQG